MKLTKRGRSDLERYDPDKGLKSIAILEGIEKHWSRAKDERKLREAVAAKIDAQCEFVAWWDRAEKQQGARGDKRPNKERRSRSGTPLQAGENGIPDRKIIHRWRKLLKPEAHERAIERTVARAIKTAEGAGGNGAHVGQNTGEYEWYTPKEYIEAARDVLGDIDLDPASTQAANRIIRAKLYYPAEADGLKQEWKGRVWMNPPYSQPLVSQFCEKLASDFEAGDVTAAVVLINNATETTFFQRLARAAGAICFPDGRVRFWQPGKESATPLQGQAVLYLGSDIKSFCERFASFGFVMVSPR